MVDEPACGIVRMFVVYQIFGHLQTIGRAAISVSTKASTSCINATLLLLGG